MDEIKKVVLPTADKKSKETGKRKVVNTKQWENNITSINTSNQIDLLKQVINKNNEDKRETIYCEFNFHHYLLR